MHQGEPGRSAPVLSVILVNLLQERCPSLKGVRSWITEIPASGTSLPLNLPMGFPCRHPLPLAQGRLRPLRPLSILTLLFWALLQEAVVFPSQIPESLGEAGQGGQRVGSVPAPIPGMRRWDPVAWHTAAPGGCPGKFPPKGRWVGQALQVPTYNLSLLIRSILLVIIF